jgi:serine/threonine protein kinase/Tol biopolymer transport system component/tetratricopeptide (TPR) repeat protein
MRPPTEKKDAPNVRSVFLGALDTAAGPERVAYLDQACGENAELRARIEALLKANDGAGAFLRPVNCSTATGFETVTPMEGPGTVIGRYKLLEKIGEGGMAVVYMAEQTEPIRRKVALKIIKLGMDTRQVIARFEAERQALALMDHPSIAKVLDAGATETGRPYFVMELVTGVSITEYCDQNNLSIKDRLALFVQVCQAVQHAHQKGIIHRDIKPSNVMVTHHEGRPVPKVIDFGIAKATNQRLTEKTLFTRYAHIIGTPAYMSPEQAELSDLDIDTRTDIYSLGVLLYELLTGTTPFSEEELRKAGYVEMQRVIREQEPAKPSTKLSTLGDTLTDIAKHRGCTPDLLRKAVRGDLDWIVMKSLEKDRNRRYETPNSLAEDIRRHLEHEPVAARGPSTTYRLHKFLRRHRSQTVAALAIAVVAGAVILILLMWNRDRLQLAEAEGFRHRGILSQARDQYARAERDAALETIKPILQSKHVGAEAQLLHAGILVDNRRSEEAVTILGSLLNERPEVAGAAHSLLARILWESESPNAEKLKEIEEHRRQAEALLPETAEAYFLRAMTAITIKEQLASLDKALQLDPAHYESRRLRAFTYYASRKYNQLHDDALVMTILRPRDSLGHSLRAAARRELGRYREAIADYDIALALTPTDGPAYVDLRTERSETLLTMGEYERVIAEAPVGANGLSPLQYHVFCALTALGRYDEATALFRQIIAPGHEARSKFRDWCAKYVFDTLAAGRSWRPPGRGPAGAAFLPMVEAEETYRNLSAKAHRLTTSGFSARWSPDGSKLAFSAGVQGYSGVAIFDPATGETDLLIVPGKDPKWSPDGKYIAFVRDCQTLRLEEFATAERENQQPSKTDEEVWVMNADGTEPRRLARGGWPSWSQDSTCLYYHSRADRTLCLISIDRQGAEPKRIMACANAYPSVSPDNRRVMYLDSSSLKVMDLASQALVAERPVPFTTWAGAAWSPSGHELCLTGRNNSDDRTGLWICGLDSNEPTRILDGQITVGSWSPDGTRLISCLGLPHFEIWGADLDPSLPSLEVMGQGQTPEEHFREMVAFYTRRIEADPQDAYAYSSRAHYYDCLCDRAKATADMRQWSVVLSGGPTENSSSETPRSSRRVTSISSDCELVFSAERPVNGIPVLSIAFGQKGRCAMKLVEIPMFVASLLGLGLVSGLDVSVAHADFAFGEPVKVESVIPYITGLNSIQCFSYDGLEMYIESVGRPGGQGDSDLWVLKRASVDEDWGPPENLGPAVNSPEGDYYPSISADGLSLYFASWRGGSPSGDWTAYDDLYVTTRATRYDLWGPAVNLGPPVNQSGVQERSPWISPDGLELYFMSWRSGGYGASDFWVTRRTTQDDPWGEPVNLGPAVNSAYYESYLSLSPDGLLLLFNESLSAGRPRRPGGYGSSDMWMARRGSLSAPWQTPVNLGPRINSPSGDYYPRISPDGRTLYFASDRSGWESYQAPINPIVDFNGDGQVDGKELLAMIVQLGGNDPLCDIGPYAWGDGVVDANDLTVLAEYIGQDVNDPTLIARWTLDETAGMTAADSAGDNGATVLGGAAWQPADGKMGGALAFDGTSGFLRTNSVVLDPAKGPLSVIAWIKGGGPNRVIVSQSSGADWLYLNLYGMLTTDLKASGTNGKSLTSDAFILDDQWHRVVLTWDGTNRTLQMDGVEVGRDTQPNLAASGGVLQIGAGRNFSLGTTTFWTGLIDDVRVYNRAVTP